MAAYFGENTQIKMFPKTVCFSKFAGTFVKRI